MHISIYGNDHSPWVQSILLAVHRKGLPHSELALPPPALFLNSGVLMPAAKIDDGPWLLDSGKIIAKLGFSEVSAPDRKALHRAFGSALERTDNPLNFWYRWSYLRDASPLLIRRLWNHLLRPFSVFYFLLLITIARQKLKLSTEQVRQNFLYWEHRLDTGALFFGGEAPDTVDFQFFGMVQMYASIPGRSLAILQCDEELPQVRAWIKRMHEQFENYPHLYTASKFEARLPEVERAPLYERPFFWIGSAMMWLGFPVTLALCLYFINRVRKKGLV